ncbi:MAG: cupredoxin family copper-binding protein [Actinomycetota bacterium]
MLAACSSSSEPSGAGSPAGGGEEVTIQGFIFRPNELTVAPGTKVTWENQDEILHTVTAEDGSFDLELPDQGTQVSFTFEVPGTYDYACSRHPSMMGVVIVEGT